MSSSSCLVWSNPSQKYQTKLNTCFFQTQRPPTLFKRNLKRLLHPETFLISPSSLNVASVHEPITTHELAGKRDLRHNGHKREPLRESSSLSVLLSFTAVSDTNISGKYRVWCLLLCNVMWFRWKKQILKLSANMSSRLPTLPTASNDIDKVTLWNKLTWTNVKLRS